MVKQALPILKIKPSWLMLICPYKQGIQVEENKSSVSTIPFKSKTVGKVKVLQKCSPLKEAVEIYF